MSRRGKGRPSGPSNVPKPPKPEPVTIQECLNVLATEVRSSDPRTRVRAATGILEWQRHQDLMGVHAAIAERSKEDASPIIKADGLGVVQ